jgi:two-component system NarL family sensor kinase
MLWIAAIAFLSAIAMFLGLALNIRERTALDDRLSEANIELKALAQEVIDARDEERTRIKKDLHDDVKPMLVAIKLKIETGMIQLPEPDEKTTAAIDTFQSAAALSQEGLRKLTDVIKGIQSDLALSLPQRLEKLVHDMTHPGLPVEFHLQGEMHDLPSSAVRALALTAQEALTNTITHAAAQHAWIRLEGTAHSVKLEICDDGDGFDVGRVLNGSRRGIGLRNMGERIESIGGQLEIISPASGTCVVVTIPLTNSNSNSSINHD